MMIKIKQGLFSRKTTERTLARGLSGQHQGCTQTFYPEALEISTGYGTTLFDMFHGNCWYYAKYFQHKNPEWDVMTALDEKGFVVHAFLKRSIDGYLFFADARGVTDDPKEFFAEFDMARANQIRKDTEEVPLEWFNKSYENAYQYIFG